VPLARESLHELAPRLTDATDAHVRTLAEGVLCLDLGDWDCAARQLAAQPALLAEVLSARGHQRLLAHEDGRARDDLARSAALRPLAAATQLLLAVACQRLGRASEARAAVVALRAVDLPRAQR